MAKGPDFHKMGKGGADMDRERINLCGQLAEVDQAMGFILAIIAGVALSFTATGLQRGALCTAFKGRRRPPLRSIPCAMRPTAWW